MPVSSADPVELVLSWGERHRDRWVREKDSWERRYDAGREGDGGWDRRRQDWQWQVGQGNGWNGCKKDNREDVLIGKGGHKWGRRRAEGTWEVRRGREELPTGTSNKTKGTGRKYKHLAQLGREPEIQTIHGWIEMHTGQYKRILNYNEMCLIFQCSPYQAYNKIRSLNLHLWVLKALVRQTLWILLIICSSVYNKHKRADFFLM